MKVGPGVGALVASTTGAPVGRRVTGLTVVGRNVGFNDGFDVTGRSEGPAVGESEGLSEGLSDGSEVTTGTTGARLGRLVGLAVTGASVTGFVVVGFVVVGLVVGEVGRAVIVGAADTVGVAVGGILGINVFSIGAFVGCPMQCGRNPIAHSTTKANTAPLRLSSRLLVEMVIILCCMKQSLCRQIVLKRTLSLTEMHE